MIVSRFVKLNKMVLRIFLLSLEITKQPVHITDHVMLNYQPYSCIGHTIDNVHELFSYLKYIP